MRRLACLLALCLGPAACSAPLQHGLDETSANEVVGALERSGIGAEKLPDEGSERGGFTIRVGAGDVPQALDVLRAAGLPRARRQGFAEVYGQPSLIPSASEERARYLEALGGEIERTLESVEGVVGARVHLVLAETDPLAPDAKPRAPARAAVLLKVRAGAVPLAESEVQRLVAGSVSGLDPGSVTVLVVPAAEFAAGGALAAVGPLRVASRSRPLLLGAAVAGLALIGVLAALLLVATRRLGAMQRAAAAIEPESPGR